MAAQVIHVLLFEWVHGESVCEYQLGGKSGGSSRGKNQLQRRRFNWWPFKSSWFAFCRGQSVRPCG